MHRFHYVQSFRRCQIIVHSERAIEGRQRGEPGVIEQIQIPEMLVCVHNLHKLTDGNYQINRNEKLLPCWPTIHPGHEFPEVTASASSRPTIPGSWGR